MLVAFAEQAAVALQQGRLAAQAAEADRLAAGQQHAHRPARRGQPRPAHPAGRDQGGVLGAALDATWTSTDADRAELVATIDESADRLTGLVDNLLDMSRLQAGAVTPALGPDRPARRRSHRALSLAGRRRPRAGRSWTGRTTCPPCVADPGLLERVVANLVGNAVRHAPTGPVAVTGRRRRTGGWSSGWSTADRGCPLADRERVFAPSSGWATSPSGQGVGLGLAVARGLTEAMGGTLTAEDTPGGGLTMVVSLPVADASRAPPRRPPVPAAVR